MQDLSLDHSRDSDPKVKERKEKEKEARVKAEEKAQKVKAEEKEKENNFAVIRQKEKESAKEDFRQSLKEKENLEQKGTMRHHHGRADGHSLQQAKEESPKEKEKARTLPATFI